ncbi:MAG: hypothetical protein KDJ28_10985 [Candidatus Competibacteraceae bacterium]|nr:hypothetical protein [Candidatus Competibacteraceae bacterium]
MNVLFETVLGLAIVYLLVSLFASTMQEILARYCGSRGRFLREGQLSLITDRWVYLRTINHPSIVAFYRNAPGKGHTPSYLPPDTVALALCDVLVRRHQMQRQGRVIFNLETVQAAVRAAKDRDATLGHSLLPLVEGAKTFEDALKAVARWYEQGMDRVSGWYKAYAQKQLFVIGLVIAATFNIDTLAIVQTLARSPALRAEMTATAEQVGSYQAEVDRVRARPSATDASTKIEEPFQQIEAVHTRLDKLAAAGLPVGYACLGPDREHACELPPASSWPIKIVGFFLTALAAALGAPFWFDLLNRVINLRSSGIKPPESKQT